MDFDADNKIKLCTICANSCTENYKEIDNVTRDNFEILSPGISIGKESVICRDCSIDLEASFNLKSTCLNVENLIISTANNKGQDQMDIIAVFINKIENKSNLNVPENDRICRLCVKLVGDGSWMYFTGEIKHVLGQYIPELNLHIIQHPVLCTSCHASLQNYFSFMDKIYGNSEQKFTSFPGIPEPDMNQFKLLEVKVKEETTFESEYNLSLDEKLHFNINNSEDQVVQGDFKARALNIKQEELNIKSEQHISDTSAIYQCYTCQFVTLDKVTLENHLKTHQIALKPTMHRCDKCQFQTKHKPALKRHSLLHKNVCDLKMYRCDNCGYETKYKHVLQVHTLIHRESSESGKYRCGTCRYQARCRRSLDSHEMIHKTASSAIMYQCESCSYLTKRKSLLNRHKRVHEDVTETTTYKCTICDCRVKYRHDLKKHMLLHADSETTMYKCEFCEHVTKYKGAIKEHMVVHQSEAEATLYPCEVCDFKTKHKKYLKRHAQTHNDIF